MLAVDIDGDAAEKTAVPVRRDRAGGVHGLACDVSDADAVSALAERVQGTTAPLDVLVNNAGVGMTGRFTDMTVDDWRWIRSVNLDGVVHGCHAFGPAMLERGERPRRQHVLRPGVHAAGHRAGLRHHQGRGAGVLPVACGPTGGRAASACRAVCPGVINTPIIDSTRFVGDQADPRSAPGRLFRRGHPPELVARRRPRRHPARPGGRDPRVGGQARTGGRTGCCRWPRTERVARQGRSVTGDRRRLPRSLPDGDLTLAGRVRPSWWSPPTTAPGWPSRWPVPPTGSGPRSSSPHCWTGTGAMWAPVARRLIDAGHRVVLYDQRGHGESTTGRAPISVERLGDDLAAVLDAPRPVRRSSSSATRWVA